jgi:hypothetical protein
MLSIGLWRWYINITITVLDTIHRHVFYLKNTTFRRLILSPSSEGTYPIEGASLRLRTEIECSLRNGLCIAIKIVNLLQNYDIPRHLHWEVSFRYTIRVVCAHTMNFHEVAYTVLRATDQSWNTSHLHLLDNAWNCPGHFYPVQSLKSIFKNLQLRIFRQFWHRNSYIKKLKMRQLSLRVSKIIRTSPDICSQY